jgi:hypothetical protein
MDGCAGSLKFPLKSIFLNQLLDDFYMQVRIGL